MVFQNSDLFSPATDLPVRLAPIAPICTASKCTAAGRRTKADFIKLLDQVESGVDHASLVGAALKAKLKQPKTGLLQAKDELVKLLAEKQASLKQAQLLAEQLKKVPAPGGLQDLAVAELKDLRAALRRRQGWPRPRASPST